MPGVSAPNNTEPKGPKHLNMIEMAAPSIFIDILHGLHSSANFDVNIYLKKTC